ncbi:MAG: PqqD family protein [Planctomycetota bacterium]|nr:PqqD family protein [Planctomycetota bacterium]
MSAKGPQPRITTGQFLAALPMVNQAARQTPAPAGGTLVEVPIPRPRYLVPPISWILPFSGYRRIELDKLGTAVLQLCDGRRSVEKVIEKFAADHKLTFRESQLSVTQFLRMLTERGVIAVVGLEQKAGKP